MGSLDSTDDNVGTGLVGAPECGDVMKLQIKVDDETGIIEDAKFKTFGCGSAIAASSLATEWVKVELLIKQWSYQIQKSWKNFHFHLSRSIVRFLQKMQSRQQ